MANPSPFARLICVTGGSGSSYLAAKLGEKFEVLNKPDAILRPAYEFGRERDQAFDKMHLANRAPGFSPSSVDDADIVANELLDFVLQSDRRIALLNTLHEFKILRTRRVEGVGFLFRDPLRGYLSFSKPQRHGNVIERLGGPESQDAISFYVRKWNALADEYFALREMNCEPWMLRYETLGDDLVRHDLCESTDDFRMASSPSWPWSAESEQFFWRLTCGRYDRILSDVG